MWKVGEKTQKWDGMWKQLSLPCWKEHCFSYSFTHILLFNLWCLLFRAQIEWIWSRESQMTEEIWVTRSPPPLSELSHKLLCYIVIQVGTASVQDKLARLVLCVSLCRSRTAARGKGKEKRDGESTSAVRGVNLSWVWHEQWWSPHLISHTPEEEMRSVCNLKPVFVSALR